jgi:FlaA1/EpsC-like NDP-sugar epimerase
MVRETVAIETRAWEATSRMSILETFPGLTARFTPMLPPLALLQQYGLWLCPYETPDVRTYAGTSRLESAMRNLDSTELRKTTPWEDWVDGSNQNSNLPVVSERLLGKRILITGAGGSIGSALSVAAWASKADSIGLLDTSENGLYEIDRSLRDVGSMEHAAVLGSVCDGELVAGMLQRHRPQIVFHAAALKHVPLMERNPFAAIENNALGTYTLARAAVEHGVEQMVLVSTDKAVDPASIMGASKRIAELVMLALAGEGTRMTAVRLCNVLGSQGSVVPLFAGQIERGGPVTVTHRDASRYFMTVDRAVAALFDALEVVSEGSVSIPEPGEAVRIMDLAERMIRTRGSSAAIEVTGLRPGDKLSERLLSGREQVRDAEPSRLRSILSPWLSRAALDEAMLELEAAINTRDLKALLSAIYELVPEYQPSALLDMAAHEGAIEEFAPVMQA